MRTERRKSGSLRTGNEIRKRAAKHFEGLAVFSTHSAGRRARPGANPFISALPVAHCPAILPGAWIQLRDTLSTSWGIGRTNDRGFLYLLPFSENGPLFRQFPFAKIHPVFLPGQAGSIKHRAPFSPSATPTGITHCTLQAKSCAKRPPLTPRPVSRSVYSSLQTELKNRQKEFGLPQEKLAKREMGKNVVYQGRRYRDAANVNEARKACLHQAFRASCVTGVASRLL